MKNNPKNQSELHPDLPDIIDIARTAKVLITQLEDKAYEYALDRMNAFLEQGDVKGSQVWMSVAHDIKYLTASQTGDSTSH